MRCEAKWFWRQINFPYPNGPPAALPDRLVPRAHEAPGKTDRVEYAYDGSRRATARRRERTRSQPKLLEITLVSDDDACDASSAGVSRWRGTRVVVARSGLARASYWIDSPRPLLRLVGLCPFGARTARRPQRRPGLLDNRDASPARARAKSIS